MAKRVHVTSTPHYQAVDVHWRSVGRAARVAAKNLGCHSVGIEVGQFGDATVQAVCPTPAVGRKFQSRVQKIMRKVQKAHRRGKIRLEG